jgi:hypothetical protein
MFNGLESDIAIPSLNIAIEWNGLHHFKPIYGQEIFVKTQNHDNKKLLIAQQKNIIFFTIPDIKSKKELIQQSFIEISAIIKEQLIIKTSILKQENFE